MLKKLKVFMICAIVFCLFSSVSVLAKDNSLYVESIPVSEETISYANEIAPIMLIDVVEYPDIFNVNINNYQDWKIGDAFTIYNTNESSSVNNEIYYFPIIQDENIVIILSVFKVDGEWSASLSKAMVDKLNNISGNYILYADDKTIYAENSNEKVILMQDHENKLESDFTKLSFSNKLNFLKNKNIDLKKNNIKKSLNGSNLGNNLYNIKEKKVTRGFLTPFVGYTPGVLIDDGTAYGLDTVGYYVNQSKNGIEYGMCWAACVASVYNYRTGGSLKAYQVCDEMGIGYDIGGTVYDIANALKQYGITNYSASVNTISWAIIQSSIKAKKPPILVAASGIYGHAVAVNGYTTLNNIAKVVFWNPGTSGYESLIYSSKTFAYAGMTFTWCNTTY